MIPKSRLRSPCPVACTLDVIGDRWTLLVIRDLFLGKRHFDEFLASPEGIATNILTARLARLVKLQLAQRVREVEDRRRVAYELTEKGASLKPLLAEAARWGLEQFHNGVTPPGRSNLPAAGTFGASQATRNRKRPPGHNSA